MTLKSVIAWARQVTTGLGASVAVPVLLAALTHQVTWPQAALPLVGAVMALLWPELKPEQVQTIEKPAAQLAIDLVHQLVTEKLDIATTAKDALEVANAVNAMLHPPPIIAPGAPARQAGS